MNERKFAGVNQFVVQFRWWMCFVNDNGHTFLQTDQRFHCPDSPWGYPQVQRGLVDARRPTGPSVHGPLECARPSSVGWCIRASPGDPCPYADERGTASLKNERKARHLSLIQIHNAASPAIHPLLATETFYGFPRLSRGNWFAFPLLTYKVVDWLYFKPSKSTQLMPKGLGRLTDTATELGTVGVGLKPSSASPYPPSILLY